MQGTSTQDIGAKSSVRDKVGAYDVDQVRGEFPALYREIYGKPLVYLDNGASAQKPRCVLEAMDYAYKMEYANVHRGLHYLSNTATAKFEDARETARRFLNAPSTDEIIFTKNSTEAINLVAASFGAMVIGEGDEIVLSIMEHHSNIVPWHFHRERRGSGAEVGADLGHGRVSDRGIREAADGENKNCRHHAYVECAGNSRADQGGRAPRPCQGHSGAGRWQSSGGSYGGRCAGSGCRFLCVHGTQDLWAVGDRCALCQAAASRRHAALSWVAAR